MHSCYVRTAVEFPSRDPYIRHMMTKEQILHLLQNSDKAVARALVVVFNNQTSDEQSTATVRYHNCKGFRPCHARMGTSMAKFYNRNGFLSAKQIAYWRRSDRQGNMRIGIYWKQLAAAAEVKANQTR